MSLTNFQSSAFSPAECELEDETPTVEVDSPNDPQIPPFHLLTEGNFARQESDSDEEIALP